MTKSRRFLLSLLSGMLLIAGLTVVALEDADAEVAFRAESPILQVAPTTTTTSTTTTSTAPPLPTTVVAPTTTTVLPSPPRVSGGAVAPPRNAYAPEPIVEIGRIRIPKIGLDHKVMHGISMRNIDQGPSHWPGTAMPGEVGNTVFMGHRVTQTRPFRRIDELVPGDEILFDIGGVQSRYVVSGFEIVTPDRLDIVNPTPTATATIFACHPPGSAKYRYVVRADLVPPELPPPPTDAQPQGEDPPPAEGSDQTAPPTAG